MPRRNPRLRTGVGLAQAGVPIQNVIDVTPRYDDDDRQHHPHYSPLRSPRCVLQDEMEVPEVQFQRLDEGHWKRILPHGLHPRYLR